MTAWPDAAYAWMALGVTVAVVLGLTCLILFGPDVDDWGDDDELADVLAELEPQTRLVEEWLLQHLSDCSVTDDDWRDDEDDAATIHWLEQALKEDTYEVDGDQLAFDRQFDEIVRGL